MHSPLFAVVPFLIGLILGWMVREVMLLRQFNARLVAIERDRDLARTEAEGLREQVSLMEADAKKAAFDHQELSARLEAAEADRATLKKELRQQKSASEAAKKECAALADRLTAQDEQIAGLRARTAQLADEADNFIEKEAAEKRLHEDLAAAVSKVAALEKQLDQQATSAAKMLQEKETLHTQLLDYQLKNAEMPGLLAASNGNGNGKSRPKKSAAEASPAPANGHSNGESSAKTAAPSAPSDDLKIINTITPANEAELNQLGITTLAQLASLSDSQRLEIAEGASRLAKKMEKEDWVGQARHVVAATS